MGTSTQGFSLVELSIVLVILGLLTGGILAGQSLIRASELRSASAEYSRYEAARHSFRDKYMALPGDMPNATRFWGDNNSACADAAITNGTPGTCNGDGDGLLETAAAANATGERFQYWNQLALTGLIEGSYTGLAGPSSAQHKVVDTNTPASRAGKSAGWHVDYTVGSVSATAFGKAAGNRLHLGSTGGSNYDGDGPTLTPTEAWGIDTKLDDGLPGLGSVETYGATARPNCATSDDSSTATYALSTSSPTCNLYFYLR